MKRFDTIWCALHSFGWTPDFTNANKLKGDKEWEEVDATRIKGVSNKEAWSTMPAEMKAYIKSLPEFDEAIFKAITED